MKKTIIMIVLAGIFLSGCYNARITTGATPSTVTVERPFASGWIFGLVPPSLTNVAQECENGVAIVETQISFLNGLVSSLTFSIYTPMSIKVTCAAASAEMTPENTVKLAETNNEVQELFTKATLLSQEQNTPVYIDLR